MPWPVHWGQEDEGRQVEQNHSSCCPYGKAGLAAPQTHKREINVFVLSLWDVEILQYAALL